MSGFEYINTLYYITFRQTFLHHFLSFLSSCPCPWHSVSAGSRSGSVMEQRTTTPSVGSPMGRVPFLPAEHMLISVDKIAKRECKVLVLEAVQEAHSRWVIPVMVYPKGLCGDDWTLRRNWCAVHIKCLALRKQAGRAEQMLMTFLQADKKYGCRGSWKETIVPVQIDWALYSILSTWVLLMLLEYQGLYSQKILRLKHEIR